VATILFVMEEFMAFTGSLIKGNHISDNV